MLTDVTFFIHFSLRKAQHVESAASIVKQYPVKGVVCVPVPQSSIKLDLRCYLFYYYTSKSWHYKHFEK